MVEQVIEKAIIDKFAAALQTANIEGIQIFGAWQTPGTNDDVKAIETAFARGYLSVKVSPRSFDTFIVADGNIAVRVELNIRAERDAKGADYLSITSALSAVIYAWHKTFATGKADFDILNEFIYTGFRLDGGDCGMDRDRGTWTWIQTFTLQGIFNN